MHGISCTRCSLKEETTDESLQTRAAQVHDLRSTQNFSPHLQRRSLPGWAPRPAQTGPEQTERTSVLLGQKETHDTATHRGDLAYQRKCTGPNICEQSHIGGMLLAEHSGRAALHSSPVPFCSQLHSAGLGLKGLGKQGIFSLMHLALMASATQLSISYLPGMGSQTG